nr:MAG TPA: hypothetical protein [Bacteriophage sp.]
MFFARKIKIVCNSLIFNKLQNRKNQGKILFCISA